MASKIDKFNLAVATDNILKCFNKECLRVFEIVSKKYKDYFFVYKLCEKGTVPSLCRVYGCDNEIDTLSNLDFEFDSLIKEHVPAELAESYLGMRCLGDNRRHGYYNWPVLVFKNGEKFEGRASDNMI